MNVARTSPEVLVFLKKISKSYQNPIDNRLTVWYNLHEIKKGA